MLAIAVWVWLGMNCALFLALGGKFMLMYWLLPRVETINPAAGKLCQNIARHPSYTKGRVTFKVDVTGEVTDWAMAIRRWTRIPLNGVVLNLATLHHPYLDVIVAHELGHLETGSDDQITADAFAAGIVGAERVSAVLSSINLHPCEQNRLPAIAALCRPDPQS